MRRADNLRTKSIEERFRASYKINETNGCWEWIAAVQSKGYGVVIFDGKYTLAHRASFKLHFGEPHGLVLHKCDNRKCVNPEHLFVGSAKDNTIDMKNKGRGKLFVEKISSSTNSAIIEARKTGRSYNELVKQFSVSKTQIARLLKENNLHGRYQRIAGTCTS